MSTLVNNLTSGRSAIREFAGAAFWRLPGRFTIARALGPSYALRCAVFHDISLSDSPFTRGMGVSTSPDDFEAALKFLSQHYNPVSLAAVLSEAEGRALPPRAVLVTFDDGYASAMEFAEPLCRKFGVPAVFFLNAAYLDNQRLAPDNIVCFVANALGMETIRAAAHEVKADFFKLSRLSDVFSRFFPAISLSERQAFLDALLRLSGIHEHDLAQEAKLYLTRRQVAGLALRGFEIGNHTYTHVRCRSMKAKDFVNEIGRNKTELEALAGREVRSFSVPYGSAADLSPDLAAYLRGSGHRVAFLSESVANPRSAEPFWIDRVSVRADREHALFLEVEVMPRLRAIRNRLFRAGRFVCASRAQAPSVMGANVPDQAAGENQN